MNKETAELIQSVSRQIQIRDVVLYGSLFQQEESLPRDRKVDVVQQSREGWLHQISESDGRPDWVHVHFHFGVRMSKPGADGADEHGDLYYVIEAEFVAFYRVLDGAELDENAVAAFAEHNGKHNIWPFWRQHVFDVCQRARLSPPEIPLYSGNSQ